METLLKWYDSIKSEYTQGICIALAILLLFGTGNFLGSLSATGKDDAQVTEPETNVSAPVVTPDTTATTVAPTTATTAPAASDTTAPAGSDTTAPAASDTTVAPAPAGAPTEVADIVAMYNKGADAVKASATKVVKNFEKAKNVPEQLVLPSAVKSIAEPLITKFVVDDMTPVEFATKEDIVANFPVAGQTYGSKLAAADVKSATCTDEGSTYKIVIELNDTKDGQQGTGILAALTGISAQEIKDEGMGFVEDSAIDYTDCKITATIDKATGNLLATTHYTPVVMIINAKVVFAKVDAEIGIIFEYDYTVTY